MLNEFQKSIKAILYDRLTSPLAGTFFFSWLVWNWGLVYYVISIDYTKNVVERIAYIKSDFLLFEYTILYPLLSTVFLIFVYPYLAIFVYKIALKFSKQKRNIKNKIENEQCLTIEESIEIRTAIENQEEKFQTMTRRRNDEIKKLNQEVELYKDKLKTEANEEKMKRNKQYLDSKKAIKEYLYGNTKNITGKSNSDSVYDKAFLKFKNTNFSKDFIGIANKINRKNPINSFTDSVDYFIASELIENIRLSYYKLTKKGKYFLKRLYEEQAK